jgi:hypothetical protein
MIYPIKLFTKNRNFFLEAISVKTQITHYYYYTLLSSRVGPDVGGLVLKEEKVEQKVLRGPLRSLTLRKASPGAYSANGHRGTIVFLGTNTDAKPV